jgi:FkbM family methyltransferase
MAIFLQSLKKHGHLDNLKITIGQIGSRKLSGDDDYGSQDWGVFGENLTIYGFDADEDATEAANLDLEARQVPWQEIHVPIGLSDKEGDATLYVTKAPMCTSLYPPNEPFLARFAGLPELVNLDFEIEIETTTLDAFCDAEGVEEIDFLQIDVQGADLNVLKGAQRLLQRGGLAIQIEVEFSPLYKDQPMFADVDTFLRDEGFSLFDLSKSYRLRSLSPIKGNQHPGQLLWGDAFFLRDLLPTETNQTLRTPEQMLKLACIADILGFADYALEVLVYLTGNYGDNPIYNCANSIAASMALFPTLVQEGLDKLPVMQKIQPHLTINLADLNESAIPAQRQTIGSPIQAFQSNHYLRHNQRRLEHLASLGLDLYDKTVLEVGAGIGDHTHFFVDRNCKVVTTEGRPENLELLKSRYPDLTVAYLDMDEPVWDIQQKFEIIYCYGLLYHLKNPDVAIQFMSNHCDNLLLLETCVSYGTDEAVNLCYEPAASATQATSGTGCRPTRPWVYNQLKQYFEFVYLPVTQPNHEQFPLNWSEQISDDKNPEGLSRTIFIASRKPINNPLLVEEIPMLYRRA